MPRQHYIGNGEIWQGQSIVAWCQYDISEESSADGSSSTHTQGTIRLTAGHSSLDNDKLYTLQFADGMRRRFTITKEVRKAVFEMAFTADWMV
jgi:hypothetical protein